jgi:hypothetical protein
MDIALLKQQLAGSGTSTRRDALKRLGLGAAGLTGLSLLTPQAWADAGGRDNKTTPEDIAVLQFALNLEYLEAEYYTYAVTGSGIEQAGASIFGSGNNGPTLVKPNPRVPFADNNVQQYAQEIAADELAHVNFIRAALQSLGVTPVAKPTIDLNGAWNTLAQAAGLVPAGGTFDPFANDLNFLLGAFVFEDVGVTAYRGAATLLSNKNVLSAAAGILGVEAYHAGIIRSELFGEGAEVIAAVQKISDTRDALDGAADLDQGLTIGGQANLVPTDANGIAFARTVQQVLNIVYFAPNATSGGFFPQGINAGAQKKDGRK